MKIYVLILVNTSVIRGFGNVMQFRRILLLVKIVEFPIRFALRQSIWLKQL